MKETKTISAAFFTFFIMLAGACVVLAITMEPSMVSIRCMTCTLWFLLMLIPILLHITQKSGVITTLASMHKHVFATFIPAWVLATVLIIALSISMQDVLLLIYGIGCIAFVIILILKRINLPPV